MVRCKRTLVQRVLALALAVCRTWAVGWWMQHHDQVPWKAEEVHVAPAVLTGPSHRMESKATHTKGDGRAVVTRETMEEQMEDATKLIATLRGQVDEA